MDWKGVSSFGAALYVHMLTRLSQLGLSFTWWQGGRYVCIVGVVVVVVVVIVVVVAADVLSVNY